MKVSKLNGCLLACNLLLLAGAAAWVWTQRGAFESGTRAAPVELVPTNVHVVSSTPELVTVTNDFRWRQLETEDYREYIQRLRGIGCPEETIRDIVISDLDKLMAPRASALYQRRPDLGFWHSEEEELANERDYREIARAQREIDSEKRAVIEELLGIDLVRERMRLKGEKDYYERRLGFLPEERRTQVRDVLEKYDQLESRLREKEWDEGEALTGPERAELRRLQEAQQAELAAILSPAEREQYELWMSDTANSVRWAAYGMDISQEEFLLIYNARKAFDQQWAGRDPALMDESASQRMTAALEQMEGDLHKQLGAERFAEFKRGEDPDFHQLAKTATRFKLPRDTAKRVYDVKRTVEDVRRALDENAALTPDQRNAALLAMRQETEATVRQLLGDRAFRYYLRTGDGSWMRQDAP